MKDKILDLCNDEVESIKSLPAGGKEEKEAIENLEKLSRMALDWSRHETDKANSDLKIAQEYLTKQQELEARKAKDDADIRQKDEQLKNDKNRNRNELFRTVINGAVGVGSVIVTVLEVRSILGKEETGEIIRSKAFGLIGKFPKFM